MFCGLCSSWEPCGKPGCWIAPGGWEYRKSRFFGMLRDEDGALIDGRLVFRPMNCGAELGTKVRCPHCGQFHLRPGYCQALDPIHKDVHGNNDHISQDTVQMTTDVDIAAVHGADVVDVRMSKREPEIEPDEEEENREARRKRLKREWMKKKREAK